MSTLANQTIVLANGYDLTDFLRELGDTQEIDALDRTTFRKTHKVYKAGLRDASVDAGGFYDQRADTTADALDDVLAAALGQDDTILTVVKESDSFGSTGFGMLATGTKYEVKSKVDDLQTADVSFQGSEGKDRIVVLHALGNEAADANGTDHDDGAATSNGAVGYLHVTDLSAVGGDSIAVTIQHSVDGVVWADLITFAAVTLDHRAQRSAIAAGVTINRHVRATWDLSAGADATFHVAFARKP